MAVELEKMQLSETDVQSTLTAVAAAVEEFIPETQAAYERARSGRRHQVDGRQADG